MVDVEKLEMGAADIAFTPAFWASQASQYANVAGSACYRLGDSIREEAVACLLGGHGIPAEVGLAAFNTLKSSGVIKNDKTNESTVLDILNKPFEVNGRLVKYRFAKQKSRYIGKFLSSFQGTPEFASCIDLRNWFTGFEGIGLKTASWIVRNWFSSNEVAILDVHIYRAGLLAGFFCETQKVAKDYLQMERQFIEFSQMLDVPASLLDATIWAQMRLAPRLVQSCVTA